jgi:hypothetical protein
MDKSGDWLISLTPGVASVRPAELLNQQPASTQGGYIAMWIRKKYEMRGLANRWMTNSKPLTPLLLLPMILGACSQSESSAMAGGLKGQVYSDEQVNCDLFSREDAAVLLGVPAASIKMASEALYEGNWNCNYNGGGLDKLLSFNLSLSPDVKKAVVEMAQYRGHLEVARGVKPFKEDLANGAYTEIEGLGDEALWTAVNGTLTVRRGNASLQISLPKEREAQVIIAEKLLSRL